MLVGSHAEARKSFLVTIKEGVSKMPEIFGLQNSQIDNSQYLQEKRLELLLDMNSKKIINEIHELRETIKRIEGDIVNLKSQQRTAVQNVQRTLPEQAEQRIVSAEPRQALNTASGSERREISSADVSIEKYFYFGKK